MFGPITALIALLGALLPHTARAMSNPTPPLIDLETPLVPAIIVHGAPGVQAAPVTLGRRMDEAGVPGISIAVVRDGKLAWAAGFGVADAQTQRPVTPLTLFQAASISKPVAAAGALRLVQDGVMSLDRDISEHLTTWRIPEPDFDPPWDRQAAPVTLRDLLGHNAGTTVRGFPGYKIDDEIPNPIGVLNGAGNTDPVTLATIPGSAHAYSGGGYTIAQVAMVDASPVFDDFPSLMSGLVLKPLGMHDSTFSQPLPLALRDRAASGHLADGVPIEGRWHVYPEMAAAGLWTTPSDLARFFVSLQQGMAGQDGPVLTSESVAQMLRYDGEVAYGLGLNVGEERIGHGGGNAGFRCVATFSNEGGDGVVIMSNGENGWSVNSDVLRTLFVRLDWPGLRPTEKTVAKLTPEQLNRCAGRYALPEYGTIRVEVDAQGVGLVAVLPNGEEFRLLPETHQMFFDPQDGVPITFDLPAGAPASAFVWSGVRAARVDEASRVPSEVSP